MNKYAYSTNEEEFYGEFDTPEEAADEAFDDNPDIETVWVGEVVPAADFITHNMVIYRVQNMIEALDEDLGEDIASDDWIINFPAEHEKKLAEIVMDYIKQNAKFSRWGVKNIREVPLR